MTGNLLYSKCMNLNINLMQKTPSTEVSRIMFDHVAGYHGQSSESMQLTITSPTSSFLKNFFKLIAYLFLPALGLVAACRLSLVAASRGYSLVMVCRLLTEVASLVAEHGL